MQTRYLYLLRYILPVTDVLMLNLVYFSAWYVAGHFGETISFELMKEHMVICTLIWLFNALVFSLYTQYSARKLERIYRATFRGLALHAALFSMYLLFENEADFSENFLFIFYVLLVVFFILNRFLGTLFQFFLIKRLKVSKKVAVMGANATGSRLAEYLKKQRNVSFYGFVAKEDAVLFDEWGILSERAVTEMEIAAASGVNDIYVSVAPDKMGRIQHLVQEADKQCMRITFIPDLAGSLAAPYTISYMGGEFPIITLRNEPLEVMGNRFKKRAFDVLFSGLVILFILSWLYPIIALLIKIQSPGPVLFKQLRSGRNDVPFWCLKFRSMRVNKASDQLQATKNDDRITKIGAFLRKSSLDELPQFFNVFWGDMSVVGPRPHMLSHTEEYKAIIGQFMVRHFVKPGITGWAQVNGYRGETKEDGAMQKRIEHDIWYLENWSSMLDLKIIFMTIINILRGEENAY